jgi:hypothetical protein
VDVFMVGSREVGPDSALGVVLAAVIAVGILDGLSQGAIFGDAADLPPAYTHVSGRLLRARSCDAAAQRLLVTLFEECSRPVASIHTRKWQAVQ